MLDTFLSCVIKFNTGLAVAVGLLGLARYRKLVPSLRWLALLAGFDACSELAYSLLVDVFGFHNNLFLTPFVIIGEIILQTLLYQQVLRSTAFSRVVPWLLGLFCFYTLLNSSIVSPVRSYVLGPTILSNLIQIGLAGLYFRKLLDELRVKHLRRDPFFWFSVALAAYGLGHALIYLFSNYLLAHYSVDLQKIIFWGVHNVFNIQLYLAYMLVLWMRPVPANAGSTRPA